jgi:hypothetical protein
MDLRAVLVEAFDGRTSRRALVALDGTFCIDGLAPGEHALEVRTAAERFPAGSARTGSVVTLRPRAR